MYRRIIMSNEKSEVTSIASFKVPSHDLTTGVQKNNRAPEA
jgi:hypothetical protein